MTNPMFYVPTLALLIFGAVNGAVMLISPVTSRRVNLWVTYRPDCLARGSEDRPTEDAVRGPEFQFRLRGLLIFLISSYLAGEVIDVVIPGIWKPPVAPTRALPQTTSPNDIWPQIFMGLIFITLAFWLLLKPEIVHHWTLDRMGKSRKEPTRKQIRTGAGILALCSLAVGSYILWVGLKCIMVACR